MLQQYFGFPRLPFTKDIPSDQLFQVNGQSELCARLDYLLKDRGLGLVTGETGSGKSTTIRRFTANLDPNRYFVIYLANPFLGLSGIYRDLLTTLGHETPFGKPKAVARIRSAFHELRRALRLTPYEAFYQRLTTHYHLPPLDLAQTIAYIRHHLQLAEYQAGPLFADDALARIYENTKGVPRLINRLCATALLVTAADNRQIVEESTVRKAIAELDQG